MGNRKIPAASVGTAYQYECPKPSSTMTFTYDPRHWLVKHKITSEVAVMVNKTNSKQLVVKKVLVVRSSTNDAGSTPKPLEIQALEMFPNCNRIVKPLLYLPPVDMNMVGTALFEYYPLGDLVQWKGREFLSKNYKKVPESFIWRFFLQMSQAIAFIQNNCNLPNGDRQGCMLHRDIKPMNFLVVDNGTTYPSFKLHDFGCAKVFREYNVGKKSRCGTYNWQPPENPLINTKAAEIWSLGACVHYLASHRAPIQNRTAFYGNHFQGYDELPDSAEDYPSVAHYIAASVPREVTSINLDEVQQQQQGIAPSNVDGRLYYNHVYSDELNDWMTKCLSHDPSMRPTARHLVDVMGEVVKSMLKEMGGQAALIDIEMKAASLSGNRTLESLK